MADLAAFIVDNLPVLLLAAGIPLVVATSMVIVVVAISARRRRIVNEASLALARLAVLNEAYGSTISPVPPIRYTFRRDLKSKAQYDRFDLESFMHSCVLENENDIADAIDDRVRRVTAFEDYASRVGLIALSIGTSESPRLSPKVFVRVEQKLFDRRRAPRPVPMARVRAVATYTSPKGRNSYVHPLGWDFAALRAGLQAAQESVARMSTVQARRQRERNLMTPRMRTQVLRRDEFRCRMCGASARDGVTLHVDHIRPVSHGGRTLESNLQTLCDSCNLGKGNSFIG